MEDAMSNENDNVVPLFPKEGSEETDSRTAIALQETIFFRFPKDARFEFTKTGEMIISLDPKAEEVTKRMWTSYINATSAALILNRIEHRIQYQRGPDGKHTVPDVLRISLVAQAGAQQHSP